MATKRGGKREGAGRKPGFEGNRKFGNCTTKVKRVPAHWDVMDIQEGVEAMLAIMSDKEEEIQQRAQANAKGMSNRDERMWDLIQELRGVMPTSFQA